MSRLGVRAYVREDVRGVREHCNSTSNQNPHFLSSCNSTSYQIPLDCNLVNRINVETHIFMDKCVGQA